LVFSQYLLKRRIRFFMRCDGFAYVGLCPIYPEATAATQVLELPVFAEAA
jgi:hypothetical protein